MKRTRRPATALAVAFVAALALAGCGRSPQSPAPPPDGPNVLRVLAGSELKDLAPTMIAEAKRVGVDLRLDYAGTLDLVDRVNAGEKVDALLPPNGAYPSLALESKPLAREKLFYSRVALGVKPAKARELGWDRRAPTWREIAAAAESGRFNYAMTNPTSSNTGMSALFALASAAAGKAEDLTAADVDRKILTGFLKGQKLTAGSSGWLADAFARDPTALDGLVNYEAVLLRLNQKRAVDPSLTIVYPADGVITADYPLLLVNGAKRDAYTRLVGALRAKAFQGGAVANAFLRPSNPDAAPAVQLPTAAVSELGFPNSLAVIDEVLTAYQGELRRPATSIYLLDVSGSMDGDRIESLRAALDYLTGAKGGAAARYARFQSRERVVLLPFSEVPHEATRIEFADGGAHATEFDAIRRFAAALEPKGGTAIYSSLEAAWALADAERARDPNRVVTVVLLTDGENRDGIEYAELEARRAGRPPVRTFPILFGDASNEELDRVAHWTGGRAFDGRHGALADVFREIRGYQ